MAAPIDLTGQRFGRLVVIERCGRDYRGFIFWRCRCDCGGEKLVITSYLRYGQTRSCGCLRREQLVARNYRHGHAKRGQISRVYYIWQQIILRCTELTHKNYHQYGGRGIKVCKRWRAFKKFLKDMGEPPPGAQIDRIDNDGDYEPGNCRWTTSSENCRNKRNNHLLTFNGKIQCVEAWGKEVGVAAGTILSRLRYGWPVERA